MLSIKDASEGAPRSLYGQVLFESGWMWGSWLQNIVAMESQWSGFDLESVISRVFSPLGNSEIVQDLAEELSALADLQHDLLIEGGGAKNLEKVNKIFHGNITFFEASGIAYLQGFDASADLLQILRERGIANLTTQPDRLSLAKLTMYKKIPPLYFEIEPLLYHMESSFQNATTRLKLVLKPFETQNAQKKAIIMDLISSSEITALRSTQIRYHFEFHAIRSAGVRRFMGLLILGTF